MHSAFCSGRMDDGRFETEAYSIFAMWKLLDVLLQFSIIRRCNLRFVRPVVMSVGEGDRELRLHPVSLSSSSSMSEMLWDGKWPGLHSCDAFIPRSNCCKP